MNRITQCLTRTVLFMALLVSATHGTGCSSTKVNETDPQSVFADADNDIKAKRYQIAIDKLRSLKNKFPYSHFAPLAQIKIADAFFQQELFQEAALTYETFRDLYPKHELSPYALFQTGQSYHKDMPTIIWRDLSTATKAMQAFQEYVDTYPKGESFESAKEMVGVIRERLAQKEYMIGRFYQKDRHYDSAKARYEKIIKNYPETSIATQAREQLQEVEKGLKQ